MSPHVCLGADPCCECESDAAWARYEQDDARQAALEELQAEYEATR